MPKGMKKCDECDDFIAAKWMKKHKFEKHGIPYAEDPDAPPEEDPVAGGLGFGTPKGKIKHREKAAEGHILRGALQSGLVKIDFDALKLRKDLTVRVTNTSIVIDVPLELS